LKLSELLEEAGIATGKPAGDPIVTAVTDDSRRVEPGTVFVATCGSRVDSHLFLSDAVDSGAAALIVQRDVPAYNGVAIIVVPDSRDAMGKMAHAMAGNPTHDLTVIGVTGTNGKTTSAYLVEAILKAAGKNPGVIGTIEYRYGKVSQPSENTTPSSRRLAQMFADMKSQGVDSVAMEVSSHAADQRRIAGIQFDACILTNITQDHLDYHGTMQAYAEAKYSIFGRYLADAKTHGKDPVAIFNIDDSYGRQFAETYPGRKLTFSIEGDADYRATDIHYGSHQTTFNLHWNGNSEQIVTQLVGPYNVSNTLGAIAATMGVGIDVQHVKSGLAGLDNVPGRLEPVRSGQSFLVLVDYAHTPDALERVLLNARHMTANRLIVVFGCGGDRDAGKRPKMAAIAARLADIVIVTNDNPRTEDPRLIADQVMAGIDPDVAASKQIHRILDRRQAIGKSIELAEKGDVVIIAGKGHEDYQILGQEKVYFDDREVAREFLKAKS